MNQFEYNQLENPEYFQENRLEAHSDHNWYANLEEEGSGKSSFRQSLNGLWKFTYASNYNDTLKGFESVQYDCKGWADIRVPAHIQLEGYDAPQYVNVQYPWDGREELVAGEIPKRFNPVASYVKYFTTPEGWRNSPIYISFQGVESAFALWCNGVFVGYSEDSFTPSEFELTPYLTEGENKLAVQVFKWCAGSWCEDQDFFRFSGIFRDVYLYTVPAVHVWDIKVQTRLNDSYNKADFVVELKASGRGRVQAALILEEKECYYSSLYQRNPGQTVNSEVICSREIELLGASQGNADIIKEEVINPLLWSAEEPNLYKLLLEVYDGQGKLQEVISQLVGFRRFEIKDGLMKLNGKRIVFKGVNRHEFSSRKGRVPDEQELWQDLITMKQHNINAIRTCHYPNDSRIYHLCDQLGLYMIDECNLESHGSWNAADMGVWAREDIVPGNRPEWKAMMLDRANSMYQRDKNHPAILIWSCGNEAHGGEIIYEMSRFFHAQDEGRIVQYEGIMHDRSYPDTSDVESQMYTPAAKIQEWLLRDRSKPFICCEYTHAMGNSCGAMHKYTDLTDTEALYQGGFIWDYIDQSIYKRDRYGEEFLAYGGDFDDRPCDYNFSGNGIVYGGDRTPSPKLQEVKFNYRNIDVSIFKECIMVTNKNLFVSTNHFACVVMLDREGMRMAEAVLQTDVAPGGRETYGIPFTLPELEGEYVITVSFRLKKDTPWAKCGHEVAFGQGVFEKVCIAHSHNTDMLGTFAKDVAKERIFADRPIKQKQAFEVLHGVYNLGVRGAEFEALFSHGAGGLVSYRYGGKELLKTTLKPNFWRSPVDNDCGNDMMSRYGQWKLASMYVTNKGVEGPNPRIEESDSYVRVTYKYKLPSEPVGYCELSYKVYGDGTIETTLSYTPIAELGDVPEFGVLWKMDADYENVEWYGNGPEETYADRQMGAKLGIYHNKVRDNMSRYLVPQECGNKTEVRYAKITDAKGRGLLIAGDRMSFSALPFTPHELENASHANELPKAHYTVIRVALAQMGVGGDDSWNARVHEEYLIKVDKELKFTFCFKGI